jgi:ureidoglycolate hydrolase
MRQDFAAVVEIRRSSARVNLALVRSQPFAVGTLIGTLERHAFSTQFFAPVDVDAYLVVVAKYTGREQPISRRFLPSTLAHTRPSVVIRAHGTPE